MEKFHPFVRPLLVDVMNPALKRNRCGEQNSRGKFCQAPHKDLGAFRGKMFSDLQRNRQVEFTLNLKRDRQVASLETFMWNLQGFTIDVVTIEADYFTHAVPSEDR